MSEKVAIVGSRQGASYEDVLGFVTEMYARHPDTILVSGGAMGVDRIAETTWQGLGGEVLSYRPTKLADEKYVIEEWKLGGSEPSVRQMIEHPSFENFKSAALYRDTLISEVADRIVGFMSAMGSPGAEFTLGWGEESQPKPRYRYYAQMPCD